MSSDSTSAALTRGAVLPLPKRLLVLLVFLATVTGYFWTESRYPDLDRKTMMAGQIKLNDVLSFHDPYFIINKADPTWKQIGQSFVNWCMTNRRGMVFGWVFAAGFLVLFRLVRIPTFRNAFANSLAGITIGTPLGVCANCVAPIAQGIYQAGRGLEAALTTIVSSPSFNFLVVAGAFTMLPTYIVYVKLAAALILTVILIPLLSMTVFRRERLKGLTLSAQGGAGIPGWLTTPPMTVREQCQESWFDAMVGLMRDYGRALWHLLKTTLPLMLLAGFLGVLLCYALPIREWVQQPYGWKQLLQVSAVATLLPVPMYFDVAFSHIMMMEGARLGTVASLSFGLGVFSIYPAFLLWRAVSWRVAVVMLLVVFGLSVAAGYAGNLFYTNSWLWRL